VSRYGQARDGYHRPPPTMDVVALFDGYDLFQATPKNKKQADIEMEARLINSLVRANGPNSRMIAVLHHEDKLRQAAYKRTGYIVRPMNGDRPEELMNLVGDEMNEIMLNPPHKLIIMGGDVTFSVLCSAANRENVEVVVWPIDGRNVAPQLKPYAKQELGDLLPDLGTQAAVVTVWLDVENHLYSLKKAGKAVDTQTYLEAVRKSVADLGDVVSIRAVADWKQLRIALEHDFQWEFEDAGVRTDYRRNIPGKSTSDMALAGSVHEDLERNPKVDIYVMGSGDADFNPVIEAIHSRGKQAYVIGLRNSTSNRLAEIADGVRYLDDYLPGLAHAPLGSGMQREAGVKASTASNAVLAVTLQVARFLHNRKWDFAYFDRLPQEIGLDGVNEAIQAGLLQPRNPGERKTVALNRNDPLTQHAIIAGPWLWRRLNHRLNVQRMPYVDTNLLARDMRDDPRCQEAQLGQTRAEAQMWFDAAAAAGLVVKKQQPHPKDPSRQIDTWWLRGSNQDTTPALLSEKPEVPVNPPAVPAPIKPGEPQPQPAKPTTPQATARPAEEHASAGADAEANNSVPERPRPQNTNPWPGGFQPTGY
jgi:hypothetical protein